MCEFCEPEKYKSLPTTNNILKFTPSISKMEMVGNKITISFDLGYADAEAIMTVNYCPQCGRKLKEADDGND